MSARVQTVPVQLPAGCIQGTYQTLNKDGLRVLLDDTGLSAVSPPFWRLRLGDGESRASLGHTRKDLPPQKKFRGKNKYTTIFFNIWSQLLNYYMTCP